MKKFLPTILLVVICIAGFWYASSKSFFKEKEKVDTKQIATIKAEDVQAVSIPSGDKRVEMTKSGDKWTMQKPAAVPLSSASVDGWVNSFTLLAYQEKIDENATDLAQYGLDKPTLDYQVTLKDGSTHKLLVGKPLPVPGTTYAKMDDSPVVYEVSDQSLQSLAQTEMDFVDKRAAQFNYDKVTSMQVEWKGQKWLLTKAEADKSVFETKWKLGDKELQPADGTALLDLATGLETASFPKAATEVKVDAPELKLEIKEKDGDKETTSTFVGKIADASVTIVKQGGAWAYAVPVDAVQAMYDKGVATLTATPSPSPSSSAAASAAPSVAPSASPAK